MATNEQQNKSTQDKVTQANPKREINWSNIKKVVAVICITVAIIVTGWTVYKWWISENAMIPPVPTGNQTTSINVQPFTNLVYMMLPLLFIAIVLSSVLRVLRPADDEYE
jgi:TRAP-type C4-dicarboxylate transport system permease small subunit